MALERLQVLLARCGVDSRRKAEALIAAGRVRVNGRIVRELGERADARRDRIEVDGRRVVPERRVVYVMHKPRGVVTTLHDPEGRPSLARYVRALPERVFPVGRLDFHTSGVLLLTNDGPLANALLHPRHQVPRRYVAKIRGELSDQDLARLERGVRLPGEARPARASATVIRRGPRTSWLEIVLTEGRNRQIHRMLEAVGARVMRLVRVSFAGITHEGLRPGEIRPLTDEELHTLLERWVRPALRRGREVSALVTTPPHADDAAGPPQRARRPDRKPRPQAVKPVSIAKRGTSRPRRRAGRASGSSAGSDSDSGSNSDSDSAPASVSDSASRPGSDSDSDPASDPGLGSGSDPVAGSPPQLGGSKCASSRSTCDRRITDATAHDGPRHRVRTSPRRDAPAGRAC
ncbi:MAG: pseudouridine synthase [Myxococcales bacterium]|nr:pseudouridine synthase [Myxococcales bacterium]